MIVPSREEDFFGAAITDSEFPFIFIESSQPRTRAIFTLAHELGHVLARDGLPCTVDRDQSHDPLDDRERLSSAFPPLRSCQRLRFDRSLTRGS